MISGGNFGAVEEMTLTGGEGHWEGKSQHHNVQLAQSRGA